MGNRKEILEVRVPYAQTGGTGIVILRHRAQVSVLSVAINELTCFYVVLSENYLKN